MSNVAEVETFLKGGAGSGDELTAAEDVGGCLDPHIEADSIAYREIIHGARIKKPRKAEAMGTATAEPLAVPEKKRRVDGVFLVESEAETSAGFAGLGSGETKSHAFRSDEARTR